MDERVPEVSPRTRVVRLHQRLTLKRCVPTTSSERSGQGVEQASAHDVGFARKVIRCKELSDSIFSFRRSPALRQSARQPCGGLLSLDGDMLSFCQEPGNLVGCLRRRTGC